MKAIILILLILSSLFSAQGQTTPSPWIEQNAVWYYTWWGPHQNGNNKIVYESDTVVNGINCQKLVTYTYWYSQSQPVYLIYSYMSDIDFTYNNADTVFYWNDSVFDVLYNFGAQTGSTWDLGVDTNGTGLCSKSIVEVDSTGTTIINSQNFRHLYLSDADTNNSVGIGGKVMEHIGSLSYLFPLGKYCDPNIIDESWAFSFSCFQDDSVTYRLVTADECENPYHVGIQAISNKDLNIEIFPNPTNGQLSITFSNGSCLGIFNLLGERVIEASHESDLVFNISHFKPGIYLAVFKNEKGEKRYEKIIKK